MTLRYKIILMAIGPLILAVTAITWMVTVQSSTLSTAVIRTFEANIMASRQAELQNYVSLAMTSIEIIYDRAGPDDLEAQEQVKNILNKMSFGDDGYFFVYDTNGYNIVHPKQEYRVDRNWWDLADSEGNYLIQALIRNAQQGGDFHRYLWEKPSTGLAAAKLSYSVLLPKWNWMLGTGIYIDDVERQVAAIEAGVSVHFRQTFLGIALITLVAVGVVFASGLVVNWTERRSANHRLKELTRRIVEIQEEERGRVSRELHDGISQILVSVKYGLEVARDALRLDRDKATAALAKGANGLDLAIGEVRRISRDLRPSILDDFGLSAALDSLAQEFQERTGVVVSLYADGLKDDLPKEVNTTLFRVAQEALTNIERHAGATAVDITLSHSARGLRLEIADNGRGFSLTERSRGRVPSCGIGLRNMRERMGFHGGTLLVESEAGQGVRLKAQLPPDATGHHSIVGLLIPAGA